MPEKTETSQSYERLLDAAEALFMEKGYKGVTLREIAKALDIKQASLYHHVPGGKEDLYVEVVERSFNRHQNGLQDAINKADQDDIEARLRAAARWILSQEPVDFSRMIHSDMSALKSGSKRARLMEMGYKALLVPLEEIFIEAYRRGDIRMKHPSLLSGGMLALISAVQFSPIDNPIEEQQEMADHLIDVFINGLRKQS